MLILNVKLVLNAKLGIQCMAAFTSICAYSVPMLEFNVKPGIQSQTLYRVFNAMLIRLVFKAPFGIESQSLTNRFKEVCIVTHKYVRYSFPMCAFDIKPGVHSQTLYLTLQCNAILAWYSMYLL